MSYVLLRHRDIPDIGKLSVYKEHGGFEAFKKVVTKLKPNEVTDTVKASGSARARRCGFPDRHEVVVH